MKRNIFKKIVVIALSTVLGGSFLVGSMSTKETIKADAAIMDIMNADLEYHWIKAKFKQTTSKTKEKAKENAAELQQLSKTVLGTATAIAELNSEDPDTIGAIYSISKTAITLIATCFGYGGVASSAFDMFDGLLSMGEDKQSELQMLEAKLDTKFEEVHNHLDEIQDDIKALSEKVDESTETIVKELENAIDGLEAKTHLTTFLSSSTGNFNYKQFKNYLYGSTNAKENPSYYKQAYYNLLMENAVKGAPEQIIKDNYDALYRSLESTSLGDSAINIFYNDYLLAETTAGIDRHSIQRYYYDYLAANRDLLPAEKSAEMEALQFALDMYTTALFADYCSAFCNAYQMICMNETYGEELNDYSRYYFGSENNDYITYADITNAQMAIEARQERLTEQMISDIAYIFHLGESFVTEDAKDDLWIEANTDRETFGQVETGQTVYLNKLDDDWQTMFGFVEEDFSYAWYNGSQLIEENEGILAVDGKYSSFTGKAYYQDLELYSITFKVNDKTKFSGGSGKKNDPYLISDVNQIALIENLDAHYKLTADLDFKDINLSPVGGNKQFNGTLDGNGKTISNLSMKTSQSVGLFASIGENGCVKNLTVKDSSFSISTTSLENPITYAGAIAGKSNGTIYNCHLINCSTSITQYSDTGSKTINQAITAYAGGFVGQLEGILYSCSATNSKVDVSSTRDYGSNGDGVNGNYAYAGGIAANVAGGVISNCYVDTNSKITAYAKTTCHAIFSTRYPRVTASAYGIAAQCSGSVQNVYSLAQLSSNYDRENTALTGGSKTSHCHSYSGQYVKDKNDKDVKADSLSAVNLGGTATYNVEYDFKDGHDNDQIYQCCEERIKLENLLLSVNGEAVEYSVVAYYNFDTLNTDKSNSISKEVTILALVMVDGENVVVKFNLPITIEKNKPTQLVMSREPDAIEMQNGNLKLLGAEFLLYYQDGSYQDVTSSVKISGDIANISVSYDTFTLITACEHTYQSTVVLPTCSSLGYTEEVCSRCGESYQHTSVDKLAHTLVLQNMTAETCLTTGYSGDEYCTVCKEIIYYGSETELLPHTYEALDNAMHTCLVCNMQSGGVKEEYHELVSVENSTEIIYSCLYCGWTQTETKPEDYTGIPRIVVSNGYAVEGGSEVVLFVQILDNPGITGASFSISYDTVLEYIGSESGDVIDDVVFAVKAMPGKCSFTKAGCSPDYNEGTLLKLILKTPNDATLYQQYNVTVSYSRSPEQFSDAKNNPLDVITVAGTITVVERLPGDVNGDDSVDILDAVLIARYLAGENDADFNKIYADVDLNSYVGITDLTKLLQYLAGGYGTNVLSNEVEIMLNTNDGKTQFDSIFVKYYDKDGNPGTFGDYGELPIPQRDGYKFDGWYTALVNGKEITKESTLLEFYESGKEMMLYARWELNQIVSNGNGATAGEDFSASYRFDGEWYTLNNPYVREITVKYNDRVNVIQYYKGYSCEFLGWALSEDGDVVYEKGERINLKEIDMGTVTLYAVWGPIVLPCSENTFGDYKIPERWGYHLSWCLDEYKEQNIGAAGDSYYVDAGVNELIIYDCWQTIVYTVSYESNGADSGKVAETTGHSVNNALNLAANGYEKYAYKFVGWNTQADGSGQPFDAEQQVTYLDDVTVFFENGKVSGSLTLYAQWELIEYTIHFNANKPVSATAELVGGIEDVTLSYEDETTLINKYTLTGWTFKGWAAFLNGGVLYEDGATVKNLTATDGAVITLYAVWEANSYAVQFNANKPEKATSPIVGIMDAVTVDYDSEITLANKFTLEGWTFLGWATEADGAPIYNHNESVSNLTQIDGGAVVLYAIWAKGFYSVQYNVNAPNATCVVSGNMSNTNCKYDEVVALKKNAYSIVGYTFMGWATSPNGNVEYVDEAEIINLVNVDGGTIILHAKWQINTYTITYNANGGTLSGNYTTTYQVSDTITLPTVSRSYYTFDGWKDGVVIVDTAELSKNPRNVTLDADLTAITYTITYNTNGGTLSGSYTTTYQVGDIITLPSIQYAKYAEYNHFVGWYIDEIQEVNVNTLSKNPENITLDAKWDLCTVYNSIDSTPWSTKGRMIIDWRGESDTNLLNHTNRAVSNNRYNNIDISNETKEIIFIGDASKVYTNFRMHICSFAQNQKLILRFVNFKFITNESAAIGLYNDKGVSLTIDFKGGCSIGSSYSGGSIIALPNNSLEITGSGNLTLTAGNGANATSPGDTGVNGGIAISAKTLVVNTSGSLHVYGGNGGNGAAGANATTEGASGGNGGNGGNGGIPVNCTVINAIQFNSCSFVCGNGGNGGAGGAGATGLIGVMGLSSGYRDGGAGGAGGNGGNGGHAGYSSQLITLLKQTYIVLDLGIGGDGGAGGNGGKGGDGGPDVGTYYVDTPYGRNGGDGGAGGKGGDGGNGRIAGSGGSAGISGTGGTGTNKTWGFFQQFNNTGSTGETPANLGAGNDGTILFYIPEINIEEEQTPNNSNHDIGSASQGNIEIII